VPDTPISKALVLTAGHGTRLRPLTYVRAKPAVPVAGLPLAARILRWLAGEGVTDAVLNLHHLPETLTAVIGAGERWGVRVRYSWEREILGSAGGPRHALPLLEADPLLIVNGDTLTDVPLSDLARFHAGTGALVTLALIPNPAPHRYGGVVLDEHAHVVGFTRRGSPTPSFHFVGVQLAARRVFADLPDGTAAATIGGVYDELMRARPGAVRGFVCAARFGDVGTLRDYLESSRRVASQEGRGAVLVGEDGEVDPSAQISGCILWDRVVVGPDTILRDCIIADDVRVPAGSRFASCAIVSADRKPAGDELRLGPLLMKPIDPVRVFGQGG
jgi:NDP-sugar pyrophosphorylase family protein